MRSMTITITITRMFHRGIHTLAEEATAAYEATRSKVAKLLGGTDPKQVIYTRGNHGITQYDCDRMGGLACQRGR